MLGLKVALGTPSKTKIRVASNMVAQHEAPFIRLAKVLTPHYKPYYTARFNPRCSMYYISLVALE